MKFLIKAKRVTDNLEPDSNLKILSLEDLLDTQLRSTTFTLPAEVASEAEATKPTAGR